MVDTGFIYKNGNMLAIITPRCRNCNHKVSLVMAQEGSVHDFWIHSFEESCSKTCFCGCEKPELECGQGRE